MKIGFITTLQTNIGDDFVREGIRAALDRVCAYEPYLIDKHQPVATCTGVVPGDAPNPIKDKILDTDVVVQCGAPVYWNLGSHAGQKCATAEWTEPLWYERIGRVYAHKPVLNIAAGACQGYFGSAAEITADPECEAFVRHIHRFCQLLTVRDRMAYEVNASLGLAARLGPCASIFAWRRCWPRNTGSATSNEGPVALNFMRMGGHYDLERRVDEDDWRKRFREIVRLLTEAGVEILPIAHSPEERNLLAELAPEKGAFYSPDYLDYFPVYAKCRGGIFNRVHGAVLLAGRGVPSVIIGNDSRTRMADEFGLPRWHVSEAEPKLVVDQCLQLAHDQGMSDRLAEIEQRAFEALTEELRQAVPREGEQPGLSVHARERRRQSVLIAHFGGLGDLVLASGMVASIKRAHPDWHVTLACRAPVADVVTLYPHPPDEVLAMDFDPYEWHAPSPELLCDLRRVLEQLKSVSVDTYLAVALQPTWFEWLLPAVFRPWRAVCCAATGEPSGFLSLVSGGLGLKHHPVDRIGLPEGTHELRRYELLLEHLHIPAEFEFPWNAAKRSGSYLVCFPSGSPKTRVKRWPADKFADALQRFRASWHLPVTFMGNAEERTELEELASRIGGASIVAGAPIAESAQVLANARLYFGNDTGPMHLCAAYGVPGVAIYGGGHWPSYAPWGRGSIGLVNPIPCFGCDWDCMFDRGVCVESIPVEEISRALDCVMTGHDQDPESRACKGLDPKLYEMVRSAAPKYRLIQGDRMQRLERIFELSHTQQQKTEAIERLAAEKRAAIAAGEANSRRIAELEQIAAERLEALIVTDTALRDLRVEADLREKGLHELTAILKERERMHHQRVAELERIAAERLEALKTADAVLRKLGTGERDAS